jgi:hypothetical protein
MAVIASKVFRITPPGHWEEQKNAVFSPSRMLDGPAAQNIAGADAPSS